jgi:AraC-like DNA-binding protein
MPPAAHPKVLRWTTDEVPRAQRFDYFAAALSEAVVPMGVIVPPGSRGGFHAEMTLADLGPLAVIHQTGTAHRSFRHAAELSRSGDHTFHLIINLASGWTLSHQGRTRLETGDAVLTDSEFGHELEMAASYEVIHLKLTEPWLRQWVREPSALVGRRIPCASTWGRVLTAFASQLSPQFVLASPLPLQLIVDQIGALLALVANEVVGGSVRASRIDSTLRERVKACLVERCADARLTAEQVAGSLGIPVGELHAVLAAHGESFGQSLVNTRTDIAARMLASPIFRRLSTEEICRRAGFADPSHLSHALRARLGLTAAQMRFSLTPTLRDD